MEIYKMEQKEIDDIWQKLLDADAFENMRILAGLFGYLQVNEQYKIIQKIGSIADDKIKGDTNGK
jgi:hypothetical protein